MSKPIEIWPTIKEVRDFATGKSARIYDSTRPFNFPSASAFLNVYGAGYTSIANRKPRPVQYAITATVVDVRAFGAGKTLREYNDTRPAGYPHTISFRYAYGQSWLDVFPEARVYQQAVDKVHKEHARRLAVGKTNAEYDAARPKGYPDSRHFQRYYGQSFAELRASEPDYSVDLSETDMTLRTVEEEGFVVPSRRGPREFVKRAWSKSDEQSAKESIPPAMIKTIGWRTERGLPVYVAHVKGEVGIDWGWTDDMLKARNLGPVWRRRFKVDCERLGFVAQFLALTPAALARMAKK